jgi:sterol desaturase/sphingolipid hydroxylase (fatty acid hydroxylase superfamily)
MWSFVSGFAVSIFALLLLATPCVIVARLEPNRKPVGFNVSYFLIVNTLCIPLSTLAIATSGSVIKQAGGSLIALPREGVLIVFSIVMMVLLNDFLEWLFHYLQHKVPLLWKLHSFHHSEEAMNATTTLRHHWIDGLIRASVIWTTIDIVLDASPMMFAVVRALYLANHIFCHMSIRVSWGRMWWLTNSPHYHRCHHSFEERHIDKNFCDLLPLWDCLFGTAYRPQSHEYPATGLLPSMQARNIWTAIIWPFRSVIQTASRAPVL